MHRLCFIEMISNNSAEKLRSHLQQKKFTANFTSTYPNPFRTMPRETPHRQTSPPARGGYSSYSDRSGAYERGRGAYARARGGTGGYGARGQAYQSYGPYRGRGQQRGGFSPPAMGMPTSPTLPMNMPFGEPTIVTYD